MFRPMPTLSQIVEYTNEYLRIREIEDWPNALNGLQIENSGRVTKIGAAVDVSELTAVHDGNNFAPRFGFSYAIDEKTAIRGGYGIFFGRTTGIMLGTSHSQNGIQVTGVTLNCTLVPNPCLTYPAIFTTPPAVGAQTPSLYLFTKDYAQPYIQQGRVGVERELFANMRLYICRPI